MAKIFAKAAIVSEMIFNSFKIEYDQAKANDTRKFVNAVYDIEESSKIDKSSKV